MFGAITKWISQSVTQWLTYDHPYEGIPLCDFERIRYELRPCDVLLIEGRSRVSEIIRSITQSSWSHAALYIGRLHDIQDPKIRNLISANFKGAQDSQLLIEGIMGRGSVISDIMSYEKDHIRLCRPRGLSRQDAQQVIAFAVKKLGHDYNVRQVMDLARFLLPWTFFPRRFRSKLFEYHPGDNTRTVCSTLIAEAFNYVEFPILPLVKQHATTGIELITRNPKLYTPRDFDYSPYFEIIKYPFVEFADYAMYRRLPWNREGLVSHDRMGVSDAQTLYEPKPAKESTMGKELKDKIMKAIEEGKKYKYGLDIKGGQAIVKKAKDALEEQKRQADDEIEKATDAVEKTETERTRTSKPPETEESSKAKKSKDSNHDPKHEYANHEKKHKPENTISSIPELPTTPSTPAS